MVTSATDLKPTVERWPEYLPNKLPDKNYVRVLDTTLREGEQAPGGSLTPSQKLEIARQLAKLRVDIMEVGFPGSSDEEFETVKTIAKTVGNEVVSLFPSRKMIIYRFCVQTIYIVPYSFVTSNKS